MKAMRVLMLAAGFIVLATLAQPTHVRADTGRVLTGELVALNGSNSQFRIVGYGGHFTAPPGTPLKQLDGHTVQVELSSGGNVLAIHDTPVPINPVEHGALTVRGEMVVVDPVARRFSVSGDTQTYSAPPSLDIAAYAGKLVEFKVDETGRVTDLHMVGTPPYGYAPPYPAPAGTRYDTYNTYGTTTGYAPPVPATTSCTYAGQPYSAGAAICQSGSQYRCDLGQWQNLGSPCTADVKPIDLPPSEPRPCIVGGATVADGSGICRDGSTMRCANGTWINTAIACR